MPSAPEKYTEEQKSLYNTQQPQQVAAQLLQTMLSILLVSPHPLNTS